MELLDKIEEYWTGRAEGYSQVNQGELATEQREKWKKNLMSHLKGKKPEETKVLDIGTGPGFFAIILAEAGYQVTAVDYTEEMLKEGNLQEKSTGSKWMPKILHLHQRLLMWWFPEI